MREEDNRYNNYQGSVREQWPVINPNWWTSERWAALLRVEIQN